MVDITSLNFGYTRSQPVLQDVSLALEPGRVYGLLGKNGEGKTTLLKILCGLRFAQTGSVSVFGHNPAVRPVGLYQDIYLLSEELPEHQVSATSLAAFRGPLYPRFSRALHAELLRELSVDPGKPLNELSHGQRKKAAVAFALATNCRLLLLDEPTNGLDIPSKSVFRRVVGRVLDGERSIVISTHQVRDVEHLIGDVAILDGGRIVLTSSLGNVSRCLTMTTEPGDREVLYAEEAPSGTRSLVPTRDEEPGALDLEFLFNAVITNGSRVGAALGQGEGA